MLYILILILIIAWALGFFVYSASGLIHLLIVVVIIIFIIKLIRGDKLF